MPQITLPDGSTKIFEQPVTVHALAQSIGARLAAVTVAGKVNEHLVDADFIIEQDATVTLVRASDPQGVEILRHSAAHLLAQAVKSLYPSAQVTIGPVIEDGFYYDFAFERPFTPEDLEKIEAKMHQLAQQNLPVSHRVLPRDEAIALFNNMGEYYKVKVIEDIEADEPLRVYQQGDFIDLCRGPHVPSTGFLKAFKLTKVAGAYWRGDANNEMLQRIYGTAWSDQESLRAYLKRLAEAEQRDHRLLAKKMDLFHIQSEAPGNIFWHPNGWQIVQTITAYLRDYTRRCGYQEIKTPQLVDAVLWERSGHKAKFDDDMFSCVSEGREYVVKPMSCPCHVQVFNQGIKSYRDLPLRLAEFGRCHRNEPSGTLHGLMRLRAFVQDDGHIFCTDDQVKAEATAFVDQLKGVYRDFGFSDIVYRLSTRPEKRVGADHLWDKAESILAAVLDATGESWDLQPGEGAFYGPKIEFSLRDCLGRLWQCGTLQLDFSMPSLLGASFVSDTGEKTVPVMMHRAILGSVERFIGILLEHYAGDLPLWLAPTQAVVMAVTDRQAEYAHEIVKKLQNLGFRVTQDLRNEKIGFKIREHTIARVPNIIVIGDTEVADNTVALRTKSGGAKTVSLSIDDLIRQMNHAVDAKE